MKKGHIHRFGEQCGVCLREHPEDHREKKRMPRKARLMANLSKKGGRFDS